MNQLSPSRYTVLVNVNSNFLSDNYGALLERVLAIPENSGNFMFYHALARICRTHELEPQELSKDTLSSVPSDNIAGFFLVFANVVMDPGYYGDRDDVSGYVEHYLQLCEDFPQIPLYVMSLGCQARTYKLFRVGERMLGLLHRLEARASFIGLRGEFTKLVMAHNGISVAKAAVVGCPSIQGAKVDYDSISCRAASIGPDTRIAITLPNDGHCSRKIQWQMDYMATFSDAVIVQDDQRLVRHAHGELMSSADMSLRFGKTISQLLKRRDNIFRHYVCISDWTAFLRSSIDICFGTRIHGTVAGILSGIPSVCLAIDSRTLELCRALYIPHVDCVTKNTELSFLGATNSPQEAKSRFLKFFGEVFSFDSDVFEANRIAQMDTYKSRIGILSDCSTSSAKVRDASWLVNSGDRDDLMKSLLKVRDMVRSLPR